MPEQLAFGVDYKMQAIVVFISFARCTAHDVFNVASQWIIQPLVRVGVDAQEIVDGHTAIVVGEMISARSDDEPVERLK